MAQVTSSHTSTAEWQSFEVRMRRRRLERCLIRARLALDAGFPDDATVAIEEARRLDPYAPELSELQQRLVEPLPSRVVDVEPAAPIDIAELPFASDPSPLPVADNRRRRTGWIAVPAALALLVSGWVGFNAMSRGTTAASAAATETPTPVAVSPAVEVVENARAEQPTASPTVVSGPEPARVEVPPPAREPALPEPAPAAARNERRPADDSKPAAPVRVLDGSVPAAQTQPQGRVTELASPPPADRPPVVMSPPPAPLPEVATPGPVATSGTDRPDPTTRNEPAPAPPPVALPVANPLPPASPPAATAASAPAPSVDHRAQIRGVLSRYEAAYTSLDAAAARAVWPGVDEGSLARAFGALESQRVTLGRCDIAVDGATAHATCAGSASWKPKVGNGGTQSRRWTFDLTNADGRWQIVRAATK